MLTTSGIEPMATGAGGRKYLLTGFGLCCDDAHGCA
jgi:hypothetical protein